MSVDHQHRHNWRFARTTRDAFGHDLQPLRRSVTFLPCSRGGRCALAAVLVFLLVLVLAGGSK